MDSSFVLACKTSGKLTSCFTLTSSLAVAFSLDRHQMWTIMSGELVRSHENQGLVAINTKLRLTFQGSSTEVTATPNTSRTMVCVLRADVTKCDDILRSFWEGESTAIWNPTSSGTSKSSTLQPFENNVSFRHERCEVALPLKAHTSKLPSESLYVDDLVTGGDSVKEATRLFSAAREIMKTAGMALRKWTSNSDELRQHLEHEDHRVCKETAVLHESTVKVLRHRLGPSKRHVSVPDV
ncbi:hypothetical protein HPB48_014877 [Haemaphysalis longicornis]|uniref:Uncharacterized protein n=1 Tax=Haemaphysalis longicornis TaxID=44386 RepID=A0A9J6FR48_HAELO|nr:hypothetical protein HPB48_014877 [Haemaphysalis longicornis]